MRQHKVLRGAGKPLNMGAFEGAGCACSDVRKESLSDADDSEEKSQEDDIEGRGEAEGREEDEEEVGDERLLEAAAKPPRREGILARNSSARAAGSL